MEQGAALEDPSQRGKKGSEDSAHATDANAGARNKSAKSIRTKFLVGTAGTIIFSTAGQVAG